MNDEEIASIKLEMINTFHFEVKKIFKGYIEKAYNNFEFNRQIDRYFDSWQTCRIDIRNRGSDKNAVKSLNNEDFLNIVYPRWLDYGRGCSVSSKNKSLNLNYKCQENGDFILYLRGVDFRNIYHNRVPIFINYKNLKFNGKLLFEDILSVWHDKPFTYHYNCQDQEEINIQIEFETIYDFFPKLNDFHTEITEENNNIDTITKILKKFEDYIFQEKLNLGKYVKKDEYWYNEYLSVENKVKDLEIDLINYKNQSNKTLDSYNILFDSIFKYHKLEPIPLVKYSRELNNQLLDFIDNVCKKYNLKWWLNFGILIGAIRHGGNVPWDDDYDISMMREDYEIFYEFIKEEIKAHNLDKLIYVNYNKKGPNNSLLSFMKIEMFDKGRLFAFVDVIPYDYIITEPDNAENTFFGERREFIGNLRNGMDRKIALNHYFELFNVSQTKTDTIIGGIEANYYMRTNYDTIFPLKNIPFEDRIYPAPNDSVGLLEQRYDSEIMKVPKNVYNHTFFDKLSGYDDVFEVFERLISHLKEINSKMKNEY